MTPTLYAFKIKPGKLDAYMELMNDCCTGSKQEEYRELLMRYGLNSARLWHYKVDGNDYVMLFITKMMMPVQNLQLGILTAIHLMSYLMVF